MKILLIGQLTSFWIKEYVYNVLDPENNEIYLLYDKHYGENAKKMYKKGNISFIDTSEGVPLIGKIPKIRTIVNLYTKVKKICKDEQFDVIEFQGMPVTPVIKFMARAILPFGNRIVCMYWGSDLLASTINQIKYSEACLDKSDYILFDSENLKEKFQQVFGCKYDEKFGKARLGTSIFEELNENIKEMTVKDCRKEFGIIDEKTIIAIGYNGRKRQQHIKILEQLNQLNEEEKNNIIPLIHMGYGLESEEYRKEIEEYLENNFKEYKIIMEFLDKRKTAMLRRSVDIFIHGQTSDALAGSVKEYLYSGAVMINPTWINYSECKKIGIEYFEYSQWEELPLIIIKAMRCNNNKEKNRKLLYDNFSWLAVKKEWDKVHYE